jgi:asparagine synthase (glutamine-hydrolysing)
MCGIAGYADLVLEPAAATDLLQRMCAVIRHRGPDDEGLYADDRAGLGMRRLSIIDVATGSQPIHNEDRTVSVVFNGEIYNYRMLRADLESRGHRFATSSDTETIVHGYEEWGEDVFARLRGMFGIAIWDARRKTLLLARDRAGIKPLHFAVAGGALIFGSEIKSILETGLVAAELDPAALDHYLSFLYTPRHTSIFAGVRKLEPGHLLRWERGRLTERRYW